MFCSSTSSLRDHCYLVMVGGDKPQLRFQLAASLLSAEELQQVLVSHPAQAKDLKLVLPRLTLLSTGQRSE